MRDGLIGLSLPNLLRMKKSENCVDLRGSRRELLWIECGLKEYYIDHPERLSSLLSILDTAEICPAAFEIFERLKKEYRFRIRR